MTHRRLLSGRWLLPLTLMVSSIALAMPPHPALSERLSNGDQPVPYYLQHQVELSAQGVDNPKAIRSLQSLRSQHLDSNFPILLILVDFSDNVSHVAGSSFDNLLFGDQTGSLKNFYTQVTYGNLTLMTVNLPSALGWARAPQTYAYYVNNQNGFGTYPHNAQKLVEDVVNAVDPYVDFSHYDPDGDGNVEGLFIAHAGPGAEYTGNNADIWSHAWGTYTAQHLDGVWIRNYSMEPEYWSSYGDMTCGVYAHEMGHAVFGLPDLYDTGYDSEGLGRWSLMAGGSWNGSLGNSPAHPDAWCRIAMGVVTPTNVTSDVVGASIPQVETNAVIYRLWTNGAGGNQYFLVENRQRTGYDTGLPASGMLIWHIDNGAYGNDHQWYPGQPSGSHYQVALEQADGLWQLEHNTSAGDGGDPYPGTTNKHTFNDTSTPDSKSYVGTSTSVAVTNISSSGATMTADLAVGSTCTPPPQVTGVSASSDRCADVIITWTDVSGETGYRVYRNGTQIGSDLAANTITYTDAGGTPGTWYNYTVAAFNGSCVGTASTNASGSRLAAPAQVTGVSATTTHCADVTVAWSDLSNETGYRVYRNGVQIGSDLAANTVSYVDASATPGTTYSYTVAAFNASCSGTVSASASGQRMITPVQVTGVAASNNRCADVQVAWTDMSGESGYRVYRDGVQIGSDQPANTISYLDATAAQGTTYNYSIMAFNGTCLGTVSATASGSRASSLPQVTGVAASNNRCTDVQVTWTDISGESGYRVYRNGSQIGSDQAANTTTYTDASAVQGTSYNYSIMAFNGTCLGTMSVTASGVRTTGPAQVTGVTASANRCADVLIAWNAVSGASGYRIYRNSAQIGSDLGAGTLIYNDAAAIPGISYTYTVAALSGTCLGTVSAGAAGVRLVTPAQVAGVSATTDHCSDITISWTDVSGENAYRVYRNGSQIGSDLPVNTTSYVDATATAGTSYSYTVAALNATCLGTVSASCNGLRVVTPAQVTGVAATNNRCTDVRISWTDLSGTTAYRVFRNGTQISSDLAAHTVLFTDTTGTSGVTYNYAVCALNGACIGALSAVSAGMRVAAPLQVSGVSASSDHCSDVTVTWNDVSNETGYRLFRNGTQLGSDLPANMISFSDSTAVPGTAYNYAVSALNGSCSGALSASASGSRLAAPGPVAGVWASTDRCPDIVVVWNAMPNATGYRVYRNGTQIAAINSGSTITFTDTTAAAGSSYSYAAAAFNGICPGALSTSATGTRLAKPPVVTTLAASSDRCSDIHLTWQDVNGETGYRLTRNGSLLATLPAGSVSYFDTTVTPGVSYSYTIQSYNTCDGIVSSAVNGTRLITPSQVTGVTATMDRCTDILIGWNDVANASGFRVLRNGTIISGDLPAHTILFYDTTAASGPNYGYTVVAFSGTCGAPTSNAANGIKPPTPPQVTNVSATQNRCSDVQLTWTESTGALGYRVFRNGVQVSADLPAHSVSYTDLSAVPGTTYDYSVRAFSGNCAAPLSNSAAGLRMSTLASVSGVTATDDHCANIVVTWNTLSGADSFQIRRDGARIAGVPSATLGFSDSTAIVGTHTYRIVAFNRCGVGDSSGTDAGTRRGAPNAVGTIAASRDRCVDVRVSWSLVAGASGYTIWRESDSVASVGASATSYLDISAQPGINYNYRVRAFSDCGNAAMSSTASGWRVPLPPVVIGVVASDNRCDSVVVTWTAAAGADGYTIYQDGTLIGGITGSLTRFAFAAPVGTHAYAVAAVNACGTTVLSASDSGTRWAAPGTPPNLTATTSACGQITLTWNAATGHVDDYEILRDGTMIGTATGLMFTDAIAGDHSYQVRAHSSYCGSGTLSQSALGTGHDVLSAVLNVSASTNSCTAIEVSWSPLVGALGYVIYRGTDSIGVTDANTHLFTDTPPAPGSYAYQIVPFNVCGHGEISSLASGTRRSSPAEVTNVTATQFDCQGVVLAWSDVPDESGYAIFRNGDLLSEVSADVATFTDTSAVPGISYEYAVRANNDCGSGTISTPATGMRRNVPPDIEHVTATNDHCDSIWVTWIGWRGDLTYLIFRDSLQIGETSDDLMQFTDAPSVGEHVYTVRTHNLCGSSAASAPVNGVRIPSATPPSTVMASDTLCGVVAIAWSGAVGAISSYEILRNGVSIGTVPADSNHFTDTVSAGDYAYSVRARGACGDSPAVETNGTCHEPPGVPPDLMVPTEACDHIRLAWTAFRGVVQVYLIYRDGVLFDSTTSILYSDTTLRAPGQHTYRIIARDPFCGESAPSAPTTAGLLPLAEFSSSVADTVHSADTLRLVLDHCTGVTGDSLFISLRGGDWQFLAAYAPIRSSLMYIVPRLDSVYTPACRFLLLTRRDVRSDSIMSLPFMIFSPPPDGVGERVLELPQAVALAQNYPNPFNPTTTIRYGLPRAMEVTVEIFDVLGRKLQTLAAGYQPAGNHTLSWNGANYATGVYFVRMRAGNELLMRKMMLLK